MRLSYPLKRDYPWRYFTPFALTLAIIALVVLTLINVIAVGYDTITVTRADFNSTQKFWWSPQRKPTCDAHQFNFGDVFYSNVSVFEYSIDFVDGSDGFLYADVPLGATCTLPYYGVKVDTTQMSVESIAGLTCQGDKNSTVYIMLSYVTRTLVDGRSFSKLSSSVGMAVLNGLAVDLLIGVLAESATAPIVNLQAGAVTCDGFGDSTNISITPAQATACANGSNPLFITDLVLTYNNRSLSWISPMPATDSVAGLPATLAESIPNYLRAASAVMLMDIGIWNNNSIFVSPDVLNATITPNTAITNLLAQNASVFPPGWETVSSASVMRAKAAALAVPVERRTPAVIAMNYVCHDQRRKSAFSFIISVIVANASMFSAIWGIFLIMATHIATRQDSDARKAFEEQPFASGHSY